MNPQLIALLLTLVICECSKERAFEYLKEKFPDLNERVFNVLWTADSYWYEGHKKQRKEFLNDLNKTINIIKK